MANTTDITQNEEMEKSFRSFVEGMFRRAGFPVEEVILRRGGDRWEVDVAMTDAGLAIGDEGAHLWAWEQILRVTLQKFLFGKQRDDLERNDASDDIEGSRFNISLDINHYRAMRNEDLREVARKAARAAALKKKPVLLAPMSAYDRRIIHTELALRPDVETESIGEAPNRKVIVKPIE